MPETTLLDGAMGTVLADRGISVAGPGWAARAVFAHPEQVARIHRQYAEAGATVHTANTFRMTARALREAGIERNPVELLRGAVALARGNVPAHHQVAVSLSSSEDCYRPDLVTSEAGRELSREIAWRAEAGADLLLCETFASPPEAMLAVASGREHRMRVWLALSPGPGGDLLSPAALAAAATQAIALGAERVLVNCVAASRALPYAEALSQLGVPWGIYANVGQPAERLGYLHDWGPASPDPGERELRSDRFAKLCRDFIELGPGVVGGCCGTSPRHIAALKKQMAEVGHKSGPPTY